MACIIATNVSPPDRPRFLLTNRCAAAVCRRVRICVSEGISISPRGSARLWFGSQPVSLKRINSMPILALDRIPVQVEFLVGTGVGFKPTTDLSSLPVLFFRSTSMRCDASSSRNFLPSQWRFPRALVPAIPR